MCGVAFTDKPKSSKLKVGGGVNTWPEPPVCPRYRLVAIGYLSPTCKLVAWPSIASICDCSKVVEFDLLTSPNKVALVIPIPTRLFPPPNVKYEAGLMSCMMLTARCPSDAIENSVGKESP